MGVLGRAGLAGVVVLALAACTGPAGQAPTGAPPDPAGSTPSATSSAAPAPAYREVEFTSPDGEVRSGRIFGDGPVGVVLSHMGRPGDSQQDWLPYAEELADRGYRVLTYQGRNLFRDTWQDVLGGTDHLIAAGAQRVILAGASIGAMASVRAAAQNPANVGGVIWLAGVNQESGYIFEQPEVAGIGCPMLFISGDQDSYGAAESTRQLHGWATPPSELLLVPSRFHGTDILLEEDHTTTTTAGGVPAADQVREAMNAFIDRTAAETATC